LSVNEPNNLFKGKYCLAYFQLKIPDDDVLVRDLKREAHKFEYATNEIDDVIFGLQILWSIQLKFPISAHQSIFETFNNFLGNLHAIILLSWGP
jgi:hypothetical protein